MNRERIKFYSHLTVTALGVMLLAYIVLKYLFFAVLPFLIAWCVAFSVRRPAMKISKATHLPYKVVSLIFTVLITFGSIAVAVSAIIYAMGEAWGLLSRLAESSALFDAFEGIVNKISSLFGSDERADALAEKVTEALGGALSSLISTLLDGVARFLGGVPRAFIFIVVTVVASVYFSLELDVINAFFKRHLPTRVSNWMVGFKNNFLKSILKYLRAYAILMLVTFIVMLFGFLTLGVGYPVLLSFIIALLDALPLIGVGTVLLPFAAYNLIFGSTRLGISLCILFIIHEGIRQFIEPRVVGKSLGIHPVVSLLILYLGYTFFGFFGLLLVPVASVVVNSITANL